MRVMIVVGLVGLTGCQSYDFQRVDPLALSQTTQSKAVGQRLLKPNVMLLVDKSGSMDTPISGTSGATRLSELKSAMNTFLPQFGNQARFGLSTFPTDSACGAASATPVKDLPAAAATDPTDNAWLTQAQSVNLAVQGLTAGGGTPTGPSLKVLGGLTGLTSADFRDDYVLLLTDGLPNCDPNNPINVCQGPNAACVCLASGCQVGSTVCHTGCMDRGGAVAQVQALRDRGVKTIVVGFGADTAAGIAPDVLNAMANAGGYTRACPNGTDAECGSGNACVSATRVCRNQFFQASNATELSAALGQILTSIVDPTICSFALDSQPTDPTLLSVTLNGESLTPGAQTWQFTRGRVEFVGSRCDQLKSASAAQPVDVQIRIVEKL